MSTADAGYRRYASDVSRRFFGLAVLLPLGAALVALASAYPGAINLVHVVAGATWAGATVYLTGVLSPALQDLEPMVRSQVTLPLIPKHVLLFTALLLATLLTGAALAGVTGRDHTSAVMVASYLVGVALLAAGVYLIRLQNQIYGEAHGSEPDMERVGALAQRLGMVGLATAGLQVIALVVMAVLRVA